MCERSRVYIYICTKGNRYNERRDDDERGVMTSVGRGKGNQHNKGEELIGRDVLQSIYTLSFFFPSVYIAEDCLVSYFVDVKRRATLSNDITR